MAFMSRITGAVALGAALLVGADLSAPPAQAGYVVTLDQVGSNVVANGSGALDVTGLNFLPVSPFPSQIRPGGPETEHFTGIVIGTSNGNNINLALDVPANGPRSFGPGSRAFAISSQGDYVEFIFIPRGATAEIGFPLSYVSNSPLTSMATFLGRIFTLGVTPGTYEWTWGSELNQNFALEIGSTALPPFAGTPGQPNCSGQSVSALAQQFGGTSNAAAQLGFSSVSALQSSIRTFCATGFIAPSAAQRSSVPEPPSLLLLGGALAGLLLVRARRRSPDAG